MNMYADKASENKSKAVANTSAAIQSADNTSQTIVQQQAKSEDQNPQPNAYQQMASNSPQVQQLKVIQEMANDSSQVKQLKDYQAMADSYTAETAQRKAETPNNTGLPDQLKTGVESLSGMSMDHVKVHYNSDKPSQLQAHAYAQGNEIHVGPGQEKHVPHEAWHVVQQAQGRVKPTMQMKAGVPVNDDAGLENEADVMGAKALQTQGDTAQLQAIVMPATAPAQLVKDEAKRSVLDTRMEDLKKEAILILSKMKELGEDWEIKYAKKGKEKGSNILGEKTDYKAEIRKAALKQIWANLSPEEKLQMISVGAKATGKALGGVGRVVKEGIGLLGESGGKKEKEPEPEEEQEESSSSVSWISDLTLDDLKKFYNAYSQVNEALDEITKAKEAIQKKAGEVGESLGAEVGKLRNEADFNKRMEALRQEFMTARKRYELLNAAITENADSERYEPEIYALQAGLMNAIQGPAMVYRGGDLNEATRRKHPDICQDAIAGIKLSKRFLGRGGLGGLIGSAFGFIGGLVESEREKTQKLTAAQNDLAIELNTVVNKSWSAFTKWVSTPAAVKSIKTMLPKQATSVQKLTEAKKLAAATNEEKSSNRYAETQIFYDAIAKVNITDVESLKVAKSIISEIGGKLG
jgi:hypothetical protein